MRNALDYIMGWFHLCTNVGLALLAKDGPLERWQTLLAGLLAIAAALIGGRFINRQIAASDKQEENRRQSKFKAARAILPLTLSYLSTYAFESAKALKLVYLQRENQTIPPNLCMPNFPKLPSEIVVQLSNVIENANSVVADVIAEMLSKIQVQTARLQGLEAWTVDPEHHAVTALNIEGYILDSAEIYARAAALFNFARRQSDNVPSDVSEANLHSALNQMGMYDLEFQSIHHRVSTRTAKIIVD